MTQVLTYVTMNSVTEGVGASQVLPYVRRVSDAGWRVVLHTFEKQSPDLSLRESFGEAAVDWRSHRFGGFGSIAGLGRVVRAAWAVRKAELIHARSDLAAAAVLAAPREHGPWVWDVRSLYPDQKIELGELRPGSIQEHVLRRIERKAAANSSAIVTLSRAGRDVLAARYGDTVRAKTVVIPTCVDLGRFQPSPIPPRPVRFMLSGTINKFYDVPLMAELVKAARSRGEAMLEVVSPSPHDWGHSLADAAPSYSSFPPAQMPSVVARAHVGLAVCRKDAGISLRTSMPTKIAEFLAVGRPVIVNPGLGDTEELVIANRCGSLLDGPSDVDRCLDEVDRLLADEETPLRCREVAERYFDLDAGVRKLVAIYEDLTK